MIDTIWAPKLEGHACTKIPYKGYEISIAMDDSCGALAVYGRSSIRVYHVSAGADVTSDFGGAEFVADAETLKALFHKIDLLERP